jgi:long-chain acyl-CoA synthetase
MALSEYLVTDDLTILLGLITASIFLLYNLYKPQSLVHPILLGRQSDVARVRMPGESAVHRNYSTGLMGRVSAFMHTPGAHAEYSITSSLVHNAALS